MKRTLRRILFFFAALFAVLGGILQLPALLEDETAPAAELTDETAAHFIDVGQGDSTLLLSGGQAILIDAGTKESGGTIVRYLQELGVEKLTAVVATHPHADHIGGMAQVIEAFPIEHFYLGPETANTATYGRMLDALEAHDVPTSVPQDGDEVTLDSGASLVFLGPADDVKNDDLNNRSLITLFRAGSHSVLLMGDAETVAEQSLLLHHPRLSCEILKVGHHGSASSSSEEFLRTVQPETAVISCGRDNDYGHPSPKTLENLSRAGIADVRITAESGTVVIPLEPSTSKENAA